MADTVVTKQTNLNITKKNLANIYANFDSHLVGQKQLLHSMLICLLCEGHILIEGMPGLAKTTAARLLASSVQGGFNRIQFTPDLLPSDVTGSEIYDHDSGEFTFKQGPIFQNFILADEINRAPAKVQSALLEAMAERQVTVGNNTYKLPDVFMVLATQNPIEQAGTYQLPEAQLDRFFMQVLVAYPDHDEELKILDFADTVSDYAPKVNLESASLAQIIEARTQVKNLYIDEKLKHYIVSLVRATRSAKEYDAKLSTLIKYGASPRATIALARAAKACAWLQGQDYVAPIHIQSVALDILRHRIVLSFEAEAENITSDTILKKLVSQVAVP